MWQSIAIIDEFATGSDVDDLEDHIEINLSPTKPLENRFIINLQDVIPKNNKMTKIVLKKSITPPLFQQRYLDAKTSPRLNGLIGFSPGNSVDESALCGELFFARIKINNGSNHFIHKLKLNQLLLFSPFLQVVEFEMLAVNINDKIQHCSLCIY